MKKSYDERMTFEYHFKYYKLYQDYYSFSSIGWEYWQYPQKYSINNMLSPEQQFIFQYLRCWVPRMDSMEQTPSS